MVRSQLQLRIVLLGFVLVVTGCPSRPAESLGTRWLVPTAFAYHNSTNAEVPNLSDSSMPHTAAVARAARRRHGVPQGALVTTDAALGRAVAGDGIDAAAPSGMPVPGGGPRAPPTSARLTLPVPARRRFVTMTVALPDHHLMSASAWVPSSVAWEDGTP